LAHYVSSQRLAGSGTVSSAIRLFVALHPASEDTGDVAVVIEALNALAKCADHLRPHFLYFSSIPASHQKVDQAAFFVELPYDRETALAFVVSDVRHNFVDTSSAEPRTQR
jgi:hypothetical protein